MSSLTVALRRHPLVRLLALISPLRGRLALAVLAGAAAIGSGVGLFAVSGFLIARAAQHPSVTALTVAVVAVRTFGISRGVFRYLERLITHDAAFRVLADVRVRIYERLERLAPAGLREFRFGDLLTRLVSDVDATQDLFIRGITPPLVAAVVGGGSVTLVLFLLAPAAGVLALGLLLAGAALPWLAAVLGTRTGRRTAPVRGRLGTEVVDLLSGAAELHAFGATDQALDRVAASDRDLTRLARTAALVHGVGAGIATLLSGLTVWGMLLLGVTAVSRGWLGTVPLAVVTLTGIAAFEAVTALPAAAAQLGAVRSAATRIGAVLDAKPPVQDPTTPRPLPDGPVHVSLRGVRVRYAPDEPWALDGVDLDLPPGRRVALVGRSGAGKSTVAAVLLRFRDVDAGTVTLNGAPIQQFAADDVRRQIGGFPQDPHVFDSTVAENLRLARPGATDRQLADAARAARLLPWIESLPEGLATPVGAHGSAMSGGERQRLALARALLADPALLILDEPTAHLDPQVRRELTADLLDATRGRATLLITHELMGLDAVDEIVVLDAGRVVERGSHDELVSRPGPYRRMWELERSLEGTPSCPRPPSQSAAR